MRTRSTRLLTVLAAGLLGLAGCSTAAEPAVVPQANSHVAPAGSTPDATTRIETLQLNGAQRSYLMMIPATAHAGALPLVVVLHGAFATGSEELARTGFGSLADRGAAVVVAPESVGPAGVEQRRRLLQHCRRQPCR